MKEKTKICTMNAGPTSWFLSSSRCNNFEMLHEKVVFEELQRNDVAAKSSRASVNAITE